MFFSTVYLYVWFGICHVEVLNTFLENKTSTIGSDRMQMIVKKLCNRDPHQFFQRLETLARCLMGTSCRDSMSKIS